VTADTQTWLAARNFLLDRSDDFFLQLARVKESFEAEAIHDLRVSTRRLREGISLFGHCFGKRQFSPLRKELKRLTAMLGAIRNTDEALLFFSPLPGECGATSAAAVVNIVAVLRQRRVTEQRDLVRGLEKIAPEALLGRIDGICSNPRIFATKAGGLLQPVADTILRALAVREKTLLELLPEALREENVAAQHRLRIAVKRFRYRLEFLAPLAGGDYKGMYRAVKGYQELLGQMHDLDVCRAMVGEMAGEQPGGGGVVTLIAERRRGLFAAFQQLRQTEPLDHLGSRVGRLV
jgi:CHAD domain-containing protein